MILTRTPFRMSFFGGGTDLESYFRKNGGAVISTTFDRYCYVEARRLPRFFDYANEVVYAQTERVNRVEDIQHPLVRNAMRMMEAADLRVTYDADLPARSGLGTSSSFAVGLLNALYALKGQAADKKTLADGAIYLERVLCREAGGWQDQIAAAYGGLNRIDFDETGYRVHPLDLSPERKRELNERLLLFFTGFTRLSSRVQQRIAAEKTAERDTILREMRALVDEAQAILENEARDLDGFGRLLHHTWELKKRTAASVSNGSIDGMYEKGMQAGALGGKLLGAGSGGFLLFYAPKDRQTQIRNALSPLLEIPFSFEEEGARIMYRSPEEPVPKEEKA